MTRRREIRGLKPEQVWDYENGFYWHSHKTRINKLLAHYELYKMILGMPGHLFEFGVYKAASLIRFATFRDLLENDFSRKIIGFDAFGAFPSDNLKLEGDREFIRDFEQKGGFGLDVEEVQGLLEWKGFNNVELIKGDVFQTLTPYLESNPEARIAMLHLDMDVKEPTEFVLEVCFDRLIPGGLIIFDDYNAVPGATICVDHFISKRRLKLEKLPFYKVPAYVRKS